VNPLISPRSVAELATSGELWQFVTQTISAAATVLKSSRASLFLFDEESGQLRLALVVENGSALDLFGDLRWQELLSPFPAEQLELWKQISRGPKPSWQALGEHGHAWRPWLKPGADRSEKEMVLGMPLSVVSQLIGLCCFTFEAGSNLENEQLALAGTLSGQAALAIQFLKLSDQGIQLQKMRQDLVTIKKNHEQLAQCLATISLYLAAAETQVTKRPSIAAHAVLKAQELSQQGMKLARDTNVALGPEWRVSENLSDILRAIIRESEEDSLVAIQFLEYGRPFTSVPWEVIKTLAEIVREALDNGVKHGRADRIVITLSWCVEKLSLHISDNGRGFDLRQVEQADEGYGISGMRDRVDRIRGQLEVNSVPNRGTELHCIIPIVNL
jgi:nitrate/nitrite-specific signal transduction histidine kinase